MQDFQYLFEWKGFNKQILKSKGAIIKTVFLKAQKSQHAWD